MTNYNDGKWHGWNGGECPVHPKSKVQVVLMDGLETSRPYAGDWCWFDKETPIVAFRVVKEYREPREWWLNVYPSGGTTLNSTKALADSCAGEDRVECVRVREVLE